jgi:hypothetical protein
MLEDWNIGKLEHWNDGEKTKTRMLKKSLNNGRNVLPNIPIFHYFKGRSFHGSKER